MSKNKLSATEKETILLKRIEKAKEALNKLKNKRKDEVAALANKHGLDKFDDAVLDKAFLKLAKELKSDNSK